MSAQIEHGTYHDIHGAGEVFDPSRPRFPEHNFHRFQLLFENGHQEGTTECLTNGRNTVIVTGIRCHDCGLRVSWMDFDRVKVDYDDKLIVTVSLPSCEGRGA